MNAIIGPRIETKPRERSKGQRVALLGFNLVWANDMAFIKKRMFVKE